jgi:beta-phosphoglucomutase
MNNHDKAIIFDMDGTLIDSEPLHLLAYQAVLSRYDLGYSEKDNRDFLGRKDIDVCKALIAQHKLELSPQQLIAIKEELVKDLLRQSAAPRDGVLKVLRAGQARSLPMAVASSATLPTIEFVVDILNIREFFQTLTSGDEVAHGKPAPDVFLLAAKRLNVKPSNCLVIEDTLNGIRAAKAAEMQCIAIPCDATKHEDHSQADAVLASLEKFDVSRWLESGVL